MTTTTSHAGGGPAGVRLDFDSIATPIGDLWVAARADGARVGALCGVGFEDGWERVEGSLLRRFGRIERWTRRLPTVERAFRRYFASGDASALTALPIDPQGTPFQRRVWRALAGIGGGRTCSYAALARRIGCPRGSRAVGMANARNPISLVVPCHRVVASDGSLGGYAFGVERKRWLLAHEGAALAGA